MSFGIIIRSNSRKSFHPHYNRAIGKYIHTREDYMKEMKDKNYVPYDPTVEPKAKPYSPSPWAHSMANQIKNDTDSRGNYKPSGSFLNELEKAGGLKKAPDQIASLDSKAGGFTE